MADDLAGQYGDLFWTLESPTPYVPGSELTPRIYVSNITSIDREYMLMASVTKGSQKLSEFPIVVEGGIWFTVVAGDIISLVGSMKVDTTAATLTLDLYEKESNEVTDSVSISLTQIQAALPGGPGIPTDILNSLLMMMIVIMMVSVMMKAITGKEEKEKEKKQLQYQERISG